MMFCTIALLYLYLNIVSFLINKKKHTIQTVKIAVKYYTVCLNVIFSENDKISIWETSVYYNVQ